MKRLKNFLFTISSFVVTCYMLHVVWPTPAWAACPAGNVETGLGCIPTGPTDFVKWVLQWALGVGAGVAFLLFLYGGFVMMWPLGGGDQRNPDKLAEGREIIMSAITGLLFIIFSVVLLEIIGYNILGIPGFVP